MVSRPRCSAPGGRRGVAPAVKSVSASSAVLRKASRSYPPAHVTSAAALGPVSCATTRRCGARPCRTFCCVMDWYLVHEWPSSRSVVWCYQAPQRQVPTLVAGALAPPGGSTALRCSGAPAYVRRVARAPLPLDFVADEGAAQARRRLAARTAHAEVVQPRRRPRSPAGRAGRQAPPVRLLSAESSRPLRRRPLRRRPRCRRRPRRPRRPRRRRPRRRRPRRRRRPLRQAPRGR